MYSINICSPGIDDSIHQVNKHWTKTSKWSIGTLCPFVCVELLVWQEQQPLCVYKYMHVFMTHEDILVGHHAIGPSDRRLH